MKVLIANKYLFKNGGAETLLLQQRSFLTNIGTDVIDFAMQHERNIQSPYTAHFVSRQDYRSGGYFTKIRSALSLIHSREAVSKFASLIEETRPDLIHCHNIYHQLTPSIVGVAKSRGTPVAVTLHDMKPMCPVRYRPVLPSGLLTRRGGKGRHARTALGSRAPGAMPFHQLGRILPLIELKRRSR
ncbi:glycosyltransferase [Bradyrhizobium sp. 157]|uniref:glycosyltransferase n=1 Tax=Bradyrhizobium sp. 157 TaxID=2782631 RepID=UPI001FFB9387|nr:glycosyltransferase [Bradyrhizobium sp. 157]MCK1636927.1 glycosyltransferase [Bradyrhizobium sp. 157]